VSYTHVTNEERRSIYEWMQAGKGVRKIAELLKPSEGRVKGTEKQRHRVLKGSRRDDFHAVQNIICYYFRCFFG
jgi:IS30 family transposase